MQSPPFPRYLVPPRSKYSPQHHVLKHPQRQVELLNDKTDTAATSTLLQQFICPLPGSTIRTRPTDFDTTSAVRIKITLRGRVKTQNMLCNTKLPVRHPIQQLCTSTLNNFSLSFRIIYKFHAFILGTSGMICSCHSCEYEEH